MPKKPSASRALTSMAIGAHPDDIEFYMAGTLLLLKNAGYQIHYCNIASGSCGSVTHSAVKTRAIRRKEAQQAAKILGATWHTSLTDDLEIFYVDKLIRRLAAVIREVRPTILLVHSPEDYMEDHTNACRLSVTAAFARGMPNYRTDPNRNPIDGEVTIYHAMPHGLTDPLRRQIVPGAFANTTAVMPTKRAALRAHQSQSQWLDVSQGFESYLNTMEELSLRVGKLSRRFKHAEGWRRHSHYGFCGENADPLREALAKNYRINREYEQGLKG